ncbi:MAG: inositol monophosphatase family protein, partial [Rubricoccaceae bacterium]
MPGYSRERQIAEQAARDAAMFIGAHAGGLGAAAVRDKGTHDLVTFVDEEAERRILARLREAFPDDAFLAEESAGAPSAAARRRWIVDPLDGTTNFAHGVPPYAVSVALEDAGQVVVGVVLEVSSGELFSAARGAGLTRNGMPARVSDARSLDAALLATGFPFRDYRYVDGYLRAFEGAIRATRGVRRHGAAAVDLAWTACGRFDGFFEAGLAPWDVAAGVLLVEEGGGRVSSLVPGGDPVHDGALVASGP